MASSVDKATPKLKGFGTGAQQIGYQVQDMIVQIQGGTSAFVAIGQQGSQLAGAFGPGGAVIGAIIALSAADELNDALAVAVVTDWPFDEPFSKDALQKLLNEYKGLGTVVAKHFNDSRKSLSEK